MTSRPTVVRAGSVALTLAMWLAFAGCSQDGLTEAQRSRATTLPTPASPGADVVQVLEDRVNTLVALSSVSVDEDLVVDGHETEVRLGWKARGTVVDASMQPIGRIAPGTEAFRSPSEFLSRSTGSGAACWARASPALRRFDRPEAAELAVLRSARATTGQGSLIKGSVSALSVLRIVGTDAQLRSAALLPPFGVRVAATFGTSAPGLLITLTWSDLVAAAGDSSRHTRVGTWTLRFTPVGTGGPDAPSADQVVSVPRNDPSFHSALLACNARIQ